MGLRSRLHKLAVMKGIEEPFRNMGESVKQKASEMAVNSYMSKLGIGTEVNKESVAKASKQVEKAVKERVQSLSEVQVNITNGMSKECANLRKTMTKEQVFEFYWSIPEFRSCWQALLWDDNYLKALIGD